MAQGSVAMSEAEERRRRGIRTSEAADPAIDALVERASAIPKVRAWEQHLADLGLNGWDRRVRRRLASMDSDHELSDDQLVEVARNAVADSLAEEVERLYQKLGASVRGAIRYRLGAERHHWRGAEDSFHDGSLHALEQIEEFRQRRREVPVDSNVAQWFRWLMSAATKKTIGDVARGRRWLETLYGPASEDSEVTSVRDVQDPRAQDAYDLAEYRVAGSGEVLDDVERDELIRQFQQHLALAERDLTLHSPEQSLPANVQDRPRLPAFADAAEGTMVVLVRQPGTSTYDEYDRILGDAMHWKAPALFDRTRGDTQKNRSRLRGHVNHLVQSFIRATPAVFAAKEEIRRLRIVTTAHQLHLVVTMVCDAPRAGRPADVLSTRTQWLVDLQQDLVGFDAPELCVTWTARTSSYLDTPRSTGALVACAEGRRDTEPTRLKAKAAAEALDALAELQAALRTMRDSTVG